MLDNVNTDLEEAIGGLDVVTRKTKDLIKKSGEDGGAVGVPAVERSHVVDDLAFTYRCLCWRERGVRPDGGGDSHFRSFRSHFMDSNTGLS